MKKKIIKEKEKNPEKFIETEEALKLEKEDEGLFVLGLLSKNLESLGIQTIIEKNENEDSENKKEDENIEDSENSLQFISNGLINRKKYKLRFDFGEKENDEILNNKAKYEKFKQHLKEKISKDYNIPIDKIIITYPQKGSVEVQLIYQSDQFNDLNMQDFINKFKNEKYIKELRYLKEIHRDVMVEACK